MKQTDIEQSIEFLDNMDLSRYNFRLATYDADMEAYDAIDIAIDALRDALERSRGCAVCGGPGGFGTMINYCYECGRRLAKETNAPTTEEVAQDGDD